MIRPLAQDVFASPEFPALSAVIERFLAGRHLQPAAAAFGIAGPVVDGRVQATNLPWLVDESDLSRRLGGIPVRLLNDLAALAHAVPVLPCRGRGDDPCAGRRWTTAPLAVVAPGTGLGEAFLVWEADGYRAMAFGGRPCRFRARR